MAGGKEGGGKEAEVEKRRVVAHLVFISFPCFLIVQAKGSFQPEAMTLLLWYFILEEDRPQFVLCACTTVLLWGGRRCRGRWSLCCIYNGGEAF